MITIETFYSTVDPKTQETVCFVLKEDAISLDGEVGVRTHGFTIVYESMEEYLADKEQKLLNEKAKEIVSGLNTKEAIAVLKLLTSKHGGSKPNSEYTDILDCTPTQLYELANKKYRLNKSSAGRIRTLLNSYECKNFAHFLEKVSPKELENKFGYTGIVTVTIQRMVADRKIDWNAKHVNKQPVQPLRESVRNLLSLHVRETNLAVRTINCLSATNYTDTLKEFILFYQDKGGEKLNIRNFGSQSLLDIKNLLETVGIDLHVKLDEFFERNELVPLT